MAHCPERVSPLCIVFVLRPSLFGTKEDLMPATSWHSVEIDKNLQVRALIFIMRLIPTQQRISLSAPSNSPIAKLAGRPGPQGHLTSHVRSAMGALVRSEWAPAFAHQETRLVLISMCRENRISGRGGCGVGSSGRCGPLPSQERCAVLQYYRTAR